MVTQSATILERHLLLAGEPPPLNPHDLQRNKRRALTKEDPMSHRIIEKRRRDRMNNCLADLSRLIPAEYLKKGRGRIEKTEIIEMAIKHMKHLQSHVTCHLESCELTRHHRRPESEESFSPPENNPPKSPPIVAEHYRLGYHECLSEAMHFLVEVEGFFAGDALCVQLISHLQKHCDKILKGDSLNTPRTHYGETTSTSSTGSSGKVNDPGSGSGSSTDGGDRSSGNNQSGEENYDGHASQLRDILTSSNLSAHSQSNRLKMMPDFPSPSHSINGTVENHSSAGSLYKFKNNIKQRFSAEHSSTVIPLEPLQPIGIKRRRSDDNRRRSETSSVSSPPPAKYQQPLSPSPPPPSPGIPIFALHSKGSFYIPLTIDQQILAPFFSEINNMDTNLASIVLHPVTISVNFQQQYTRPIKTQCSTDIQCWNQVPNNYMQLPKWTS